MQKSTDGSRRRKGWRGATAIGALVVLAGTAVGVAGAQSGGTGDGTSDGSASAVAAAEAEVFVSLTPQRVLDTRPPPHGPIGVPSAGRLGPDSQLDLSLIGSGLPLPAGASTAVLNVTLDQDATSKSYLTIWPKGTTRPATSANNPEPGFVTSNSMIAKLGADDAISIYNAQGETNVIIDVVGYLLPIDQVSGLGSHFLVGDGGPGGASGDDGDMYFDTTSRDLYGPKAAGVWGSPVANLSGTATTSSFTPSDGNPCPKPGEVVFNTTSGEISICAAGVWEAPVEVRSTIDAALTYQQGAGTVAVGTTLTDVATFTAPANGNYILDASVTLRQRGFADFPGRVSNISCRWSVGSVPAGPSFTETIEWDQMFQAIPPAVFLAPKGNVGLGSGDTATLQCAFDTPIPFVGLDVESWAFTATRTPALT